MRIGFAVLLALLMLVAAGWALFWSPEAPDDVRAWRRVVTFMVIVGVIVAVVVGWVS